ncbi:MAG: UbiD family decarboxylase [Pseudorhodoplanes sp.]|uniref:UbiD family decarboxylase n=1 Tax=Pseudorhodoplanes sp. TaxID=1934341 RepID=UPI003D100340
MDLRSFLNRLREVHEIIDIRDPVSLDYEVGAICRRLSDAAGPAAILHRVGDATAPLVVNVYGTRRRVALALGTTESDLLTHVVQRLKTRIPTELGTGEAAPCQEVVIAGRDINILQWPFPLWNLGDAGRYITAGNIIARHPEFGWNIAYHRAQLYNETELGICMAPEHHLRFAADEARGRHKVEAAIVIGVRPSISIAAGSDFSIGDYELDVAGALEGRPIRTVRCKTVDAEVPADTEMVIEGFFGGEVRDEGPFVEFTGYQTRVIQSPVFTITAITHRRDPIVHGVFAGKPPCETNTIWRELEESIAFDTLRGRYPLLKAVHRPPELGRDFIGILQINAERLRPGIVRTLSLATAAVMPRLKYIIVVDDDVDIYNFNDVMWAVATRCDPKADMASIDGTMTSWLDPSSGGLTGKVFFDATKKQGFGGTMPGYPPEALLRADRLIEAASVATNDERKPT